MIKKEESKPRILLIDDDDLFRQAMTDYLSEEYVVFVSESGEKSLALLNQEQFNLILLDITLPGQDGITLLKTIRSRWPEPPVIMLTAVDRIQTVVECIKLGAVDYLAKPIIVEELVTSVERALESSEIRKELEQRRELQLAENREYRLLGSSAALERIKKQVQVVCRSDSPVLITGETGTGKELAARQIHACSPRAREPFVAINCGAIPKDLFETEFFGYKRGAFTGAQASEIGKLQLANRGTLLLDEISELPLDVQTKLLRVIEGHQFYPVGSTQLAYVDIRVIACTNRDLGEMVKQKIFREDLYFRLNVYTIHMPPLRERDEDIVILAEHYMREFNRKFDKKFAELSAEARQMLIAYPWKGNVRELRNVMERVVLSEDDQVIRGEHLFGLACTSVSDFPALPFSLPENGVDLEEVEKQLILQALRMASGNKTKAAKLLRMSPPTLYYRLEKYGIT